MKFRIAILLSLSLILAPIHGEAQVHNIQDKFDGWNIYADTFGQDYAGVATANGILGLVPDYKPFGIRQIMLNHVFDYYGSDMVSRVVKGPNPLQLELAIDGKACLPEQVSAQNINLKSATHTSWFTICDTEGELYAGKGADSDRRNQEDRHEKEAYHDNLKVGKKADVRYSYIALRNLPHCIAMEVEITAAGEIDLCVTNRIGFPDDYKDASTHKKEFMAESRMIKHLSGSAMTHGGRHTTAAGSMVIHDKGELRLEDSYQNLSITLSKDETLKLWIISSICSTADFSDPINEVSRQIALAERLGIAKVLKTHQKEWDELWEGDIEITGNDRDWKTVKLALYSLYSFGREGTRLSIPPMGLSSQGYNGHVFWDSELWMYPPMLMMAPDIAKSMIDYRVDRLDKAVKRASAYGYRGAMFPWKSDDLGEEATPVWAITGPMEHHITADVAIAAWNYYLVTKDKDYLSQNGWPLLSASADFWVSRVTEREDGSLSIEGVVGADEYANNVTDNAFTNGAAVTALEYAIKAAKVLGKKIPEDWKDTAKRIRIPQIEGEATPEYEGYDGRMIKQADVNLLAYPLGIITDRKQIIKDLEYYEDKIDPDNGPAMSFSIFAILYARLGLPETAYRMFRKCYQPFIRPPFSAFSETATSSNPYFATGAGGLLQAVLCGFGGLEITPNGVVQKRPVLPSDWERLVIKGVGPEKKLFVIRNSR